MIRVMYPLQHPIVAPDPYLYLRLNSCPIITPSAYNYLLATISHHTLDDQFTDVTVSLDCAKSHRLVTF